MGRGVKKASLRDTARGVSDHLEFAETPVVTCPAYRNDGGGRERELIADRAAILAERDEIAAELRVAKQRIAELESVNRLVAERIDRMVDRLHNDLGDHG